MDVDRVMATATAIAMAGAGKVAEAVGHAEKAVVNATGLKAAMSHVPKVAWKAVQRDAEAAMDAADVVTAMASAIAPNYLLPCRLRLQSMVPKLPLEPLPPMKCVLMAATTVATAMTARSGAPADRVPSAPNACRARQPATHRRPMAPVPTNVNPGPKAAMKVVAREGVVAVDVDAVQSADRAMPKVNPPRAPKARKASWALQRAREMSLWRPNSQHSARS